jgi:hypothetical protein
LRLLLLLLSAPSVASGFVSERPVLEYWREKSAWLVGLAARRRLHTALLLAEFISWNEAWE